MKSEMSLGDLKKRKIFKNFYKKRELSIRITFFFDSEHPYETRTSLFLSPLVY